MSEKVVLIVIAVLLAAASANAQCPSITVNGPSRVTLDGDAMTFRAEVGVVGARIAYKWSVNAGTIEDGQGTAQIIVRTDKSMKNTNVVATVEVEGLPSACEKTASAAGPVGGIVCGLAIDEWEKLTDNEVRSRLDAFFANISNDSDYTGLIVLQVTAREKFNVENKRIKLILSHVRFRKFDLSRIWFSLEPSEMLRTKLYSFLPGAEIPCDNCTIIKGSDIK